MSAINIEKISIVHWYPELEAHKCGYCKTENGGISYGMWAEQLTVEDYQNLIDRGWRRSGMYCYKPIMEQTCCPQYTIRCKALEFQLTKSQKKVIKRFNKFVNDGITKGNKEDDRQMEEGPHEQIIMKERPNISIDYTKLNGNSIEMCSDKEMCEIQESVINVAGSSCDTPAEIVNKEVQKIDEVTLIKTEKLGKFKEGVGADPNKPPCKKAKLLRLERKQQKLLDKSVNLQKPRLNNEAKTLEDFINEIPANSKYKLKIKHERVNKNHSAFKISAELFKKYQMTVHNEPPQECGEKEFCEFLVNTPLKCIRVRGDSCSVTYGTFHQQYWLDDKLIAVAVLDILPRCVSSVYFFYDPDYRFLTLGTYGSLREIQYVQSLQQNAPAIEYYYMGYYIHACPKMRYKGKLSHSFLLCPETYQWFPIDNCIVKLEKSKYSRLNDDIDALDENICTPSDIDSIKVCVSYSFTVFGNYKRKYGEQEVFDNIGKLIGKKCADNLLFVSSKR